MKSASRILKKAENGMRNHSSKNRNDIAGQSLDIELHVFLGDTSVQILQKLKVFMLETGHDPGSFQTGLFCESMFDDITNWESPNVQTKCLSQAEEVCGQDQKTLAKKKTDHLTNMLTEDGIISRFVW